MILFDHSQGRCLNHQGASIYFESFGDPEGEPLLFLHGGLGSMEDFNGNLDSLSDRFRIIGIDFRGHGGSTLGTAPLRYSLYQADVEAILEHLGIDSVSVIGLSDGGIVGYRMAVQNPGKVRRLITIGSQWRLEEGDPSIPMLKGLTSQMWLEMFPDSLARYKKINPEPDFDKLLEKVVSLWTDMGEDNYPKDAVKEIKAPLLIVRGDEDYLFSLSEAEALSKRVENASFLNIPFAGHEAHKEGAELFIQGVNQFLERS